MVCVMPTACPSSGFEHNGVLVCNGQRQPRSSPSFQRPGSAEGTPEHDYVRPQKQTPHPEKRCGALFQRRTGRLLGSGFRVVLGTLWLEHLHPGVRVKPVRRHRCTALSGGRRRHRHVRRIHPSHVQRRIHERRVSVRIHHLHVHVGVHDVHERSRVHHMVHDFRRHHGRVYIRVHPRHECISDASSASSSAAA